MSEIDPRDEARADLLKNLRSRKRLANGAWYPTRGESVLTERAPSQEVESAGPTLRKNAVSASPPEARGATARPSPASKVFESQGSPRPASAAGRAAELKVLHAHAAACARCGLHAQRTQAVFGTGSPQARLMFVGEGPGRDEDAQGVPFVGRAGQKLNSLIEKLGFKREDVYIANVVKCRPPENRVPLPEEAAACRPYLTRQIELVAPEIIICLGLTATQALLNTKETMAVLRKSRHQLGEILVIATYHPAYVLRNPKAAWDVWADVKDVADLLKS